MSAEPHPYTAKLREEMDRLRVKVRGQQGDRRGIAEASRLAPSRVEEIVAGDRPTMQEHLSTALAGQKLPVQIVLKEQFDKALLNNLVDADYLCLLPGRQFLVF